MKKDDILESVQTCPCCGRKYVKIYGMVLIIDEDVPDGEIWFKNSKGEYVGSIEVLK